MATLSTDKALRGRVFARRRAFLQLPVVEQQRVRALADFLDESRVFRQRRVGFRHSVEGISCDQLVDIVLGYLEKHPQLLERQLEDQHEAAESPAVSPAKSFAVSPASLPAAPPVARVSVVATLSRKHVVWTFIDELVLSGFLAIHNEADDRMFATKLDDFGRPGVLFVPTQLIASDAPVSVWRLLDVAILAGTFQRASKLTKTSGGRDTYYVVDGLHKVLYRFDSDGATDPEGSLVLQGAVVQSSGPYQTELPDFQVKITCATTHESVSLFGSSAADWINPLLRLGAVYDTNPLRVVSKAQLVMHSFGRHHRKPIV